MGYTKEAAERLMHYQKKYGNRGSESWNDWIIKKRTINTAVQIITSVSGMKFEEFELCLYFRCDDENMRMFLRKYEGQMEEAVLNPDNFVRQLDSFYRKTCFYIEENHLYRDFFDFTELLAHQRRKKIDLGQKYKDVFDAYLSLLMQQTMYFCRYQLDESIIGLTAKGEPIFRKNPNPYIDVGSYKLEKRLQSFISGKVVLTPKQLYEAYRPYGYEIHSLDQVQAIEAIARVYDNNQHIMIPYISEQTMDIVLQEPYRHHEPVFPRIWKETEVYRERLQHRNYMLPAAGIKAKYTNAGDINEIYFAETLHSDEIVLLYRVVSAGNGEYSGCYHTKSQVFYSIFEHSNRSDWHDRVENFILENYMILTCNYDVDRKKNYAIRQVDAFEREFHYPYQPLVIYSYKNRGSKGNNCRGNSRKYVKEEYMEELRTRNGYIRRLPVNQQASEHAVQYAMDLGLYLPEGMTFVRSHEYKVYRKVFPLKSSNYAFDYEK